MNINQNNDLTNVEFSSHDVYVTDKGLCIEFFVDLSPSVKCVMSYTISKDISREEYENNTFFTKIAQEFSYEEFRKLMKEEKNDSGR